MNAHEETARRIVNQEVRVCLSSLVSTLALGGHGNITVNGGPIRNPRLSAIAPIMGLCDQAGELAAPVPDYEEAAREAGWDTEETTREGSGNWYAFKIENGIKKVGSDQFEEQSAAWRDLCDGQHIEPYDREVYEHWAVSDWLADKLIAHGEKVDKDFAGMCVWARTTTGQAIYADDVIEQIAKELALAA